MKRARLASAQRPAALARWPDVYGETGNTIAVFGVAVDEGHTGADLAVRAPVLSGPSPWLIREITVDETGSLAVAGNITSRAISCGGHLHAGGSIKATLLIAFDGGNINTPTFDVELAILYAYCALNAGAARGKHFELEHGVQPDDPAYVAAEKAVPKSCLTADAENGVHRIDFIKLHKAAIKGKLTLT